MFKIVKLIISLAIACILCVVSCFSSYISAPNPSIDGWAMYENSTACNYEPGAGLMHGCQIIGHQTDCTPVQGYHNLFHLGTDTLTFSIWQPENLEYGNTIDYASWVISAFDELNHRAGTDIVSISYDENSPNILVFEETLTDTYKAYTSPIIADKNGTNHTQKFTIAFIESVFTSCSHTEEDFDWCQSCTDSIYYLILHEFAHAFGLRHLTADEALNARYVNGLMRSDNISGIHDFDLIGFKVVTHYECTEDDHEGLLGNCPVCGEAPHTHTYNCGGTCTVCGQTGGTPSGSHAAGSWTSYDDTSHYRTCTSCGTVISGAHFKTVPPVYADFTAHHNACGFGCGYYYPPEGHSYIVAYNAWNHWLSCGFCVAQIGNAIPHTYGQAVNNGSTHTRECTGMVSGFPCNHTVTEAHFYMNFYYNHLFHQQVCSGCSATGSLIGHTVTWSYETGTNCRGACNTGCGYSFVQSHNFDLNNGSRCTNCGKTPFGD